MAYTVPALPYAFDALEPYIDAKTMEIHHDKHHGAYVTNLNTALANNPELQNKSAEELIKSLNSLPEGIRTAVRSMKRPTRSMPRCKSAFRNFSSL